MSGLAFTSPFLLLALLALPVIWWLLRITPPRPEREIFPPLKILAGVIKREESPASSPWWLTLLRIILAALVIIALAGPLLNPQTSEVAGDGPLVIVMDNGWASAPDWPARVATAEALINQAQERDIAVSLVFTAETRNDAAPMRADQALDRLAAAKPRPLKTDRDRTMETLATGLDGQRPGTVAFITDGLAATQNDNTLQAIGALKPADVKFIRSNRQDLAVLANATNSTDSMKVTAKRLDTNLASTIGISARDNLGRIIATSTVTFPAGQTEASGEILSPFELRNEFARLEIDSDQTAGAVRLLDDSFKRRRIGLLSGESGDKSQPLLSPLYYIERALLPFANLSHASSTDLSIAIPALIAEKPSAIIMADIGRIPTETEKQLTDWINQGGTLIRFAGPRLATAASDDPLIPVRLRKGERALGGALSWSTPQPLAAYPENSPFAGLQQPDGILVQRQVLAEPSPELASQSWANLADGTPLVTARKQGAGRIVLFHVSAEASWSNLPISGHFVEMLRRLVQLSRASSGNGDVGSTVSILPPYRLLTAQGTLTPQTDGAKPLSVSIDKPAVTTQDNPPGLYGNEDGFTALNLINPDDQLFVLYPYSSGFPVSQSGFIGEQATSLKPPVLLAGFLLLLADTLIVLWLGGKLQWKRPGSQLAALALLVLVGLHASPAEADDSRPGDNVLLSRLDTTHLAFVITGESEVDQISERGMAGLSDFLFYRTTLEPGDPVGVDISKDELAVFPIIYWPVSATAPMPSSAAISRIDAYMRSGGTVLFDTRDQFSSFGIDGGTTANTQRMQQILASIDIPPLEPVPSDHVLTKSFYLLKSFPGRYNGSPLWIEAQPTKTEPENRPARSGDGVSPIIITGNDFAGAWAIDKLGTPLLPTVPTDPNQREYAYRAGVNIMMYMLTGNYKADQVHVPALLERLGQ